MNITVVMIVVAGLVVLAWVTLAYAMGRYFGRQEQMLEDLKREYKIYRQEVDRKQNEMEEDWQAYYVVQEAEDQARADQAVDHSGSNLQPPENVQHIKKASYTQANK